MIYVTGANGQLGSELRQKLGPKAVFLNRDQLDLSDIGAVERFLKQTKIELLINAGAYTLVDKAETEQKLALIINSETPKLMSKYSREKKFKLIHFSSDYVFNGNNFLPYVETDLLDPVNFYGKTKLEGERGVLEENPESLILRTSWVYSSFGKNFVKTVLRIAAERDQLNIVFDQVGTLTFAQDLADTTLKARELSGIYHYSNEGVSSWYDVAIEIRRIMKLKTTIMPILSHEYPTPAKRPHYSVLNKNKIKQALGISIPHWTESLEICLQKPS
jgi:dTDP-4-dehydrorhamnose reductase